MDFEKEGVDFEKCSLIPLCDSWKSILLPSICGEGDGQNRPSFRIKIMGASVRTSSQCFSLAAETLHKVWASKKKVEHQNSMTQYEDSIKGKEQHILWVYNGNV